MPAPPRSGPPAEGSLPAWRERLDALSAKGQALEAEGLPFPTEQIRATFEGSARAGDVAQASMVVKRGEALLDRVAPDWTWVKELLRRADELRGLAERIGVDVGHLDNRVGNPRRQLSSEPLSAGSLEKAAASASLSLAVLHDAIPKFCLQEAEQLGASIRRARDRGEDVGEAARTFSRLIQAVQDQNLPTTAERLLEVRRAVGRIPRAPAVPAISPDEEEEILMEARNLARRLQRIKGKAQNAQSAARLMAQVRAAISEDRRYGTPEEEIEALWAEVSRLTQEKRRATAGPDLAPSATPEEAPEGEGTPPLPSGPEAPPLGTSEEEAAESPDRPSYYAPYVPPDLSGPETAPDANADSDSRPRSRPRPRA